jgi:hypothetical protein
LNSSSTQQGQSLQNLLSFLSLHSLLPASSVIRVLSYRRPPSQTEILSLVPLDSTPPKQLLSRWEHDFSGRRVPRRHNLSTLLDPTIRIKEARDLNNNLMKWRVASGIDLDIIKSANIVVLGMGTLGCGVVRTLMVILISILWGLRSGMGSPEIQDRGQRSRVIFQSGPTEPFHIR